ncbi:MAG: Ribonuclease 3 [Anaerolineales bacterium]|nr:Ribonuclease 3 [Anaerolineales bacterium]
MSSQPNDGTDFRAVQELVERLGLPVKKMDLFERALTHSSYVNESPRAQEDNERLEFLGDAVLDFLAGAWAYHHFADMAEGELTRLRSSLVRTEQLASFARDLNFGPALRLGRGELTSGGRDRDALLCDAFEAFIGALYLETSIELCAQFIEPMFEAACGKIFARPDLSDSKSRLQEHAQGNKLGALAYAIVNKSGPEHSRTFEIEVRLNGEALGSGSGSSKAIAEQAAASAALKTLGLE